MNNAYGPFQADIWMGAGVGGIQSCLAPYATCASPDLTIAYNFRDANRSTSSSRK